MSYYVHAHYHNRGISRFIWGNIVQSVLDNSGHEQSIHRIRKQSKRFLPSGGSPIQFYRYPQNYGGEPCLIPIPPDDTAALVKQFVPENLFFFCDDYVHHAATTALESIGSPKLTVTNGWDVFVEILPIVQEIVTLPA